MPTESLIAAAGFALLVLFWGMVLSQRVRERFASLTLTPAWADRYIDAIERGLRRMLGAAWNALNAVEVIAAVLAVPAIIGFALWYTIYKEPHYYAGFVASVKSIFLPIVKPWVE